jgi:hypothetical protein
MEFLMLKTNCHCGNFEIQANSFPASVTRCNCSICRRYGALWAYYDADQIEVKAGQFPVSSYKWGKEKITFHSCSNCDCVMYHSCIGKEGTPRVGVNSRMAEPEIPQGIQVRLFDGADTWEYLNE